MNLTYFQAILQKIDQSDHITNSSSSQFKFNLLTFYGTTTSQSIKFNILVDIPG